MVLSSIQSPVSKKLPPKAKNHFWKDRSDELREALLLVDQEKLERAGRTIKSVGSGLQGAWKQVKAIPTKVFDLPIVEKHVDENRQKSLLRLAENVGRTVGFMGAGAHGLGGALKIASGHQQRDLSKKLEGVLDLATASTVAATIASLPLARSVLAPITAALNIGRGTYNAGHGFKINDSHKQIQGGLDALRSVSTLGRLLKSHGSAFGVAGMALTPVVGALQAGRGLHDLSLGLKNEDNNRELKGLVDIATAVGTGLAFASGVALIPGIVLAVAANAIKVAYELSPRARKKIDPLIDKVEPGLAKLVTVTDRVTKPIQEKWKSLLKRFIKPEARGFSSYTPTQLAEITALLRCDGSFTGQESRRLNKALESIGQSKDGLRPKDPPMETNRKLLLQELKTEESRSQFLEYMRVVANFDNIEKPAETKFLRELAKVLNLDPEQTPAPKPCAQELEPGLAGAPKTFHHTTKSPKAAEPSGQ